MANVEYNTKLLIHFAQRKYSGKYKIVAENEHGKDEAEVEITILGKLLLFVLLHITLINDRYSKDSR